VDWIDLTQEIVEWRGPENTIMNLPVPKKCGNYLDQLLINLIKVTNDINLTIKFQSLILMSYAE
jgi:hypothetical protein